MNIERDAEEKKKEREQKRNDREHNKIISEYTGRKLIEER